VHTPRSSYEELEIRTKDGVALRAFVVEPPDTARLRGTCVLAHALFARASEFGRRERPGLAHAVALAGFRAIAFDFRGHGESTLPRSAREWGYDDLVRFDLPAVVGCARARAEDAPVLVLGHSLGGHTALAAQGTGQLGADGIVAVAASPWLREVERSRVRWAAKVALARTMRKTADRLGAVPARRLRVGSDDASRRCIADIVRVPLDDEWRSADHRDDYRVALTHVTVPICSVASVGDRLVCTPENAELFVRPCRGPKEMIRVTRGDDGGPAPGHMALVTTSAAHRRLLDAVEWVAARATSDGGRASAHD